MSERLCYVVDHHPVLSQTFIWREHAELESRLGPINILALRRKSDRSEMPAGVTYLQDMPFRSFIAHLKWFWVSPRRYWRFLKFGSRCGIKNIPWLAMAPLASELIGQDVAHVHFALRSSLMTRAIQEYRPLARTVVLHAFDIFHADDLLQVRCERAALATISRYNADFLQSMCDISVDLLLPCGVDIPDDDHCWESRLLLRKRVLAVGRLVEKKGFEHAIRTLALCPPDFSLDIVGDGPELDKLRNLCRELNVTDRVSFLGAKAHQEVLDMMQSYSAMIVPSVVAANGDVDGIPVVLIEAMAKGLPVLVSPLPSILELVDPSAGWIINPADHQEAADTLMELLLDSEKTRLRSIAARNLIRHGRSISDQADAAMSLVRRAVPVASA